VDGGYVEAVDVVAAAAEHACDAGEDAKFIFYKDRDSVSHIGRGAV
jgi:hypothetical protein